MVVVVEMMAVVMGKEAGEGAQRSGATSGRLDSQNFRANWPQMPEFQDEDQKNSRFPEVTL